MDAPLKRDYQHDFDLNDPELNTRWDEVVAHLHTGCPVARSDVGEGYWVVSRYTDVVRCAKEWATFSAADGFMVNRPEGLPYFAPGECDPPLHEALRAAIAPFLRPRAVGALEPAIRRHANALIDAFCAQGQTDIVASFANPLPQLVFSVEVAGMDPVDMPYLLEVFDLSGPAEQRASNFALGIARIDAYLRQRAEQAPRGDIVDALLAFEFEGYTWQDKVGTLSQLTIGGIGTTGFAISGGLHYLATHPDARRRLVADHSLIPRAIDEFLRVFMGAPNMARRVKAETEVAGVRMQPGDRVLLSFGAASRDPSVCERPQEIDLARPVNRHLAFGAGNHSCIGASLARLVLQVGFEAFLERIPEFRVPEDFVPRYETANTRHMVSLPLLFDRA
ncbi:MAG: cytochrome P450 [Gammaproteobacteria bacterium]|jgi:cytochrome P450|nr:cytochrome P450 [Gammaproteobacteria bacterium]